MENFPHPSGKEHLYFLKLSSDIEKEVLLPNIYLKRIEIEDWMKWFGRRVHFNGKSISSETISVGPYSGAQLFPYFGNNDPVMMMQNNYVLYADLDIQGNSQVTGLVDRTIRLFATGSSGLTCGIKKSGLQAIIPEANWDRLPITKINKSDLKEFIALFSIVQSSTGDKNQLVIERYLNATQGDDVVRTHSRYLDFITILEMVFVPDGKSGEIAHKLKMRASCVLATLLGTSKQDLSAKIKHIYKKRSDIVHSGTMAEMIPQDWYELAEICRLAVCEYLRSPASFTADRLDNAVLA